jgi:DUF2950 family protein
MRTHSKIIPPVLVILAVLGLRASAADTPAQKQFAKPEAAVRALLDALRAGDQAALIAILGPGSEDVVSSGDPIADRAARKPILTGAAERTRLETLPSGAVIAHFGKDDWPLPIPLVQSAGQWHFDTAAGRDEILNRRIGRNELKAIDVCRVYVEAQREHAKLEHDYAQKLRSDPGKRDGLYWEDPTGKHPSPLGPLLAEAAAEGYSTENSPDAPRPYHGYLFRILTGQGPHAPGGAKSYLKDGKMTGGFAMVAYPADYGASGVMTFLVDAQGIVYQKNLLDQTDTVAKQITAYDPDDTWTPVRD